MNAAPTTIGTLNTDQVENHPLVDDVNTMHTDQLSGTERVCRKIADSTGAPIALLIVIVVQLIWVVVGSLTGRDPYPFLFLLTLSNIVQLVMIFVISVAQRQQNMHDELRAEADHDALSRLLYHQQLQDQILLRLAERTGVAVGDLTPTVQSLLAPATA